MIDKQLTFQGVDAKTELSRKIFEKTKTVNKAGFGYEQIGYGYFPV